MNGENTLKKLRVYANTNWPISIKPYFQCDFSIKTLVGSQTCRTFAASNKTDGVWIEVGHWKTWSRTLKDMKPDVERHEAGHRKTWSRTLKDMKFDSERPEAGHRKTWRRKFLGLLFYELGSAPWLTNKNGKKIDYGTINKDSDVLDSCIHCNVRGFVPLCICNGWLTDLGIVGTCSPQCMIQREWEYQSPRLSCGDLNGKKAEWNVSQTMFWGNREKRLLKYTNTGKKIVRLWKL